MSDKRLAKKFASIGDAVRNHPLVPTCVALFALVGFGMRVACCFHGWPDHFHVDEPTVVASAIDMLARHSWESPVYFRPDQFEIKCDSIIFTLFSWVKYGQPAYEAFAAHETAFYVVARLFTACFGTAMIPLSAFLCGELMRGCGSAARGLSSVLAAWAVAFAPVLIEHSAYATPDVVLAFVVMLFSLLFARYLRGGGSRQFVACCVLVGVGISIKYPAAVLCVPLAFMVVYRCAVGEGRPAAVPKYALMAVLLVSFTVFVIAPNLFTDIRSVIESIRREARPNHLGFDGLGFFGNFLYYARVCVENYGWVSVAFFVFGNVSLAMSRRREAFAVLIGYWFIFCMSALSLHWERWGVPAYPFYGLVVVVGVGTMVDYAKGWLSGSRDWRVGRVGRLCLAGLPAALSVLVMANVLVGGACAVRYSLLPTTFEAGKAYCNAIGATQDNCITDGCTPLTLLTWTDFFDKFSVEGGYARLADGMSGKRYLVVSSSHKERYFAEAERYRKQVEFYDAVDATYTLINVVSPGNAKFTSSGSTLKGIFGGVAYLASATGPTGHTFWFYDLGSVSADA